MEIKFTDELRNAIEEARKQINQRRKVFQTNRNVSCCEDEPLYETNKRIIFHTVAAHPDKIYSCEEIYRILALIDGFYGTQVQTPFALRDLACAIYQAQVTSSKSLWNLYTDYLSNNTNTPPIFLRFNGNYGIGKKGYKGQEAPSLISKFGYFITDWHFPIYDSFVRELLPIIGYKVGCASIPQAKDALKDIATYITAIDDLISTLFPQSKPRDYYDALDYVLWRMGKIYRIDPNNNKGRSSNPSLLINRSEYQQYRTLCNQQGLGGDILIFRNVASDSLLKQCVDLALQI